MRSAPATRRRRGFGLAGFLGFLLLLLSPLVCGPPGAGVRFLSPEPGLLAAPGDVEVRVRLPFGADPGSLVLEVDGEAVDASGFSGHGRVLRGVVPGLEAGRHELAVRMGGGPPSRRGGDATWVELVELDRPGSCEILNQAECVLPFPSSRFLERADTPTGRRVAFAPDTLPAFSRTVPPFGNGPLDPEPFRQNDGFSPTAQVLMHFPGGVDPVASDAPRILPETRTYDERGLDRDSPTVLLDLTTGRRVNHWIENDVRATDPERTLTFLRPAESLRPGHRYAVAVRNLIDPHGDAVEAEPVFAAIRDGRPSELPAVEARRHELARLLRKLRREGIRRDDLVLAFEFGVQSDESLTSGMLAMRDQAYAWLEDRIAEGAQTFTVDSVEEVNPGCGDPDEPVWRQVRGTFQVPLFLERDPFAENTQVSFLRRDAQGMPRWEGTTDAPYGISVPCAALGEGGTQPLPPLVIGHGLFGEGPGTVASLTGRDELADFRFISAGTNWSGLSSPDIGPDLLDSFIFKVVGNLDDVQALPDRLRQGQTNTLLLTRMLKRGVFNADPAFQGPGGEGVIRAEDEVYYFGASLGGIMGTMYAALTPDVQRFNVDVPAINFSLLLQRAAPFLQFEILLDLLNPDPMAQAVGLSLIHELWVRGEPAGYATHVTRDRLPGVESPRHVLMTVALYDQQVSNLGSQLAGATLGLPNLEGSVQTDLAGLPDVTGPRKSGYVVYDTASFDLSNPAHLPFVPPLENLQAEPNRCDPHGRRGFIPASVEQLLTFLTPGGRIENFCSDDGVCNASSPEERPSGATEACDPLG